MLRHIVVMNGAAGETAGAWAQLIAERSDGVVDVAPLQSAATGQDGESAARPDAPATAVESGPADLLVVGLEEEVDGSMDGVGGEVADHARIPVLLVPPPQTGTDAVAPARPRSLLVALDAATFTNGLLEPATELAGLFGAGLWLLHADRPLAGDAGERRTQRGDDDGDRSQRYVASLIAGRRPAGGVHVQGVGAATGTTAILEAARAVDADLIVLAPPRSGGHVLQDGGAAQDVLRVTRRPVLLVRPR